MPVLLKTKGKTTTDHISPAGPWLRYRGHLDKFSDNMFMGAINAYTGEAGKGNNVLTGETEPADRHDRARLQGAGRQLGRRRRRQLRRGQQPRARRAVAAPARRRRGHRAQLRPHPRVQPQEAGPPGADVPEPGATTTASARTTASAWSVWRTWRRASRSSASSSTRTGPARRSAQPLLQCVPARLVPQGLGAEPVSPVTDLETVRRVLCSPHHEYVQFLF